MARNRIGNALCTLVVTFACTLVVTFAFPLVSNADRYNSFLEFQADDQSMWQAGDAWQLNWRQDITLYEWDYSFESPRSLGLPHIPFFDPLPRFSVYGHTDGNIGV